MTKGVFNMTKGGILFLAIIIVIIVYFVTKD